MRSWWRPPIVKEINKTIIMLNIITKLVHFNIINNYFEICYITAIYVIRQHRLYTYIARHDIYCFVHWICFCMEKHLLKHCLPIVLNNHAITVFISLAIVREHHHRKYQPLEMCWLDYELNAIQNKIAQENLVYHTSS